jgi:peptide/nickel transport system permease protein
MSATADTLLRKLSKKTSRNSLAAIRFGDIVLYVIVAFFLMALVVPSVFAPYDPLELSSSRLEPPSWAHWFGTDEAGRDILSRTVYALRPSLGASLMVVGFSAFVGSTLGVIAGYRGGFPDAVLMRIIDVFLAFPYLILAIALSVSLGAGIRTSIIVLSTLWWPSYARQFRGQVLALKTQAFVDSARVSLVPTRTIVFKHFWPHLAPHIAARASMAVGNVILALASLSFLGLGAQPPIPELGSMIAKGRNYMLIAWWYSFFPGLVIVVIVLTSLAVSDRMQQSGS